YPRIHPVFHCSWSHCASNHAIGGRFPLTLYTYVKRVVYQCAYNERVTCLHQATEGRRKTFSPIFQTPSGWAVNLPKGRRSRVPRKSFSRTIASSNPNPGR